MSLSGMGRLLTAVRTWVGRAGFVGVTAAVLLVGYHSGFVRLKLSLAPLAPLVAIAVREATLSVAFFGAFLVASALVFLARSVRTCRCPSVSDAGAVTAVVPVHRDAGALERSVESLRRSTYDDLSVVVVPEPGDERSIGRARELADGDGVEMLVNTGCPGSKAGAINYAVAETDSEYVSVHDADEVVDPEFHTRAIAELRTADVVQGRTVPEPDGFVESLAYYESVLLSYVARRVLYVCTGFRMAASRAVVMRRATLDRVGGYDEGMLTEDFHFAYRCYRDRVDVTELLDAPSRINAAHTLSDWWGQRKRWMTGYAQVLHRLVGTVQPVTDYRNVLAVGIAGGTLLGSLLMVTVLSKFAVLLALGSATAAVLPLAGVVAVSLCIHWHDHRRGLVGAPGWSWLLVPLLLPVYSLSAIKAVLEYLLSWDGEWYSVSKIE